MINAEFPMSEVVEEVERINQQPRVVSSSLGFSLQWIDSPELGVSIILVTNIDHETAINYVDQLSKWVWTQRDNWVREPLKSKKALEQGKSIGKYFIILADQSDNAGGGPQGIVLKY